MQFQPIKQSFKVQYDYQLYFTSGLFTLDNPLFSKLISDYKEFEPVKLLFVLDDGVKNHHPKLIHQIESYCNSNKDNLKYTDTIVLQGGEQVKNSDSAIESVLKGINENKICRHSFVVVIGGGAVIDMVGYAAAIAHRGVKLIRIPTTVLSQNDSAVGVKNSVNAFKKKNFLGTFAPPYAIINDSNFLETLEQRDWISGISEAIKVALIKDEDFFQYIANHASALKNREMEPMQYVIYKCAEMHMHHIAQGGDPFESGSSRPLDFGHWAAHKMEFMTNYELRHGEAVAKGIALDVTYAQLIGLITESDLQHILNVMVEIGFDLSLPVNTSSEIETLMNGIEEFREHLGGQLTITLISGLGVKHDVHTIDMKLMTEAIGKLNHQFALN
ncbi:3-dehydroquinate synthase [uncultured Maribacter sp.]|uniref:3-dehydroquinate synthase n=1 Tax=uncultured Maribacter sp. TaxID=431308 RepID=UPI0030DB786F|tara:strand:+ start:1056 stop:2216 length:1161 start_codon:yes stop_codon:yes gene_type:complete